MCRFSILKKSNRKIFWSIFDSKNVLKINWIDFSIRLFDSVLSIRIRQVFLLMNRGWIEVKESKWKFDLKNTHIIWVICQSIHRKFVTSSRKGFTKNPRSCPCHDFKNFRVHEFQDISVKKKGHFSRSYGMMYVRHMHVRLRKMFGPDICSAHTSCAEHTVLFNLTR